MSDLQPFLVTTGRTLSQMALYSPEHPTVKGAVDESHRLLAAILQEQPELAIAISEGKLVVNGKPPETVPEASLRPFVQLLAKFDLFSLSFVPGITQKEMVPFFHLAYRQDLKKTNTDVAAFLAESGVTHIKANQSKYTKISEDETVGGKDVKSDRPGDKQFIEKLSQLPLDSFLEQLIARAVTDPEDRKRLFERVYDLIKKEIQETVAKETKQLRKEKTQVSNERERTEGVVETMAEGVVVVDETGNVLMMNSAAEQLYGVNLGESLGKPLWEGVREEHMVSLAKELMVPTDRPIVKEVELRGMTETRKTLRSSSATVQDPNGRVVGMVSVLSDVTRERELVRMQNEFMANVTHDLRAPIHALKLAVSAILEGSAGPVSPEQTKMLGMASRNVDRLNRLIGDLLDFSQAEEGTLQIRQEVVDIAPVLKDAITSMDSWAKNRKIVLTYETKGDMDPVYIDTDRILQVVNNLISNAIKFTPPGGKVTLRATPIEDKGQKKVRVEVEDSGQGVSKLDQKRIFDRFVQLKNREKLDIRGTGIGLSICRALVDAHKSSLAIESPPPGKDKGSLFWFSLGTVARSAVEKHREKGPDKTEEKKEKEGKGNFWSKMISKIKLPLLLLLFLPGALLARPYHGKVRRVLEGDLIQLENGTRVRYLGIDAPDKGSPYYAEALSANRGWVEKREVRFEYGLQLRDEDGNWQAYVFSDGLFVNKILVQDGLALVTRLSNDEEYLTDLLKAERKAHRKKRGMWRDTVIDPYRVRIKKKTSFPWASQEEIKKGIKK